MNSHVTAYTQKHNFAPAAKMVLDSELLAGLVLGPAASDRPLTALLVGLRQRGAHAGLALGACG